MTISSVPTSGIPVWVAYFESRLALRIKHSYEEQARCISYKLRDKNFIGRRRWNINYYYYSETESLWCGNWNHLVCGEWKCEVDHPSQSTVVNLGKKQKWCSLWCPWSQVQQDTPGQDNFRILGCLWTIHHRCTCKWDYTEMLTVSFPLRAKTVWIPLRMNTERCRRGEGRNSYPLNANCQLEDFSGKNHENIVN